MISVTLELSFLVFIWNGDFVLLWDFLFDFCCERLCIPSEDFTDSLFVVFFFLSLFSQASICQIIVTTGADPAIFPKQLAEKNGIVLQALLCFLTGIFFVVIKNKINETILSSKLLELD